jgi:cytochrome b involved in lipid metabolism
MNKVIKKIILFNLLIMVPVLLFILVKSPQTPKETPQTSETQGVENNTSSDSTEVSQDTVSATSPSATVAVAQLTAVPDNRCLITISGKKYNVTDYRNKHPGGDIFTCGSDMTTAFNNQHGSSTLKKMTQYLVK